MVAEQCADLLHVCRINSEAFSTALQCTCYEHTLQSCGPVALCSRVEAAQHAAHFASACRRGSLRMSARRVYSTLLLQLAVPNAMLGRVLSLEMAAFTATMSLSSMWTGTALDELGLGPRTLALAACSTGAVVALAWSLHAWLLLPCSQLAAATQQPYEAAASHDEVPERPLQLL